MDIQEIIRTIIGRNWQEITPSLTVWQMIARAAITYLLGIFFIRINRRFVAIYTPFDVVVTFAMGSILASGIVGNSPFWQTLAAAAAVILMNKFIGFMSYHNSSLENIFKGYSQLLVENGKFNKVGMKRNYITENDLISAIRQTGRDPADIKNIKKAYLENIGNISIVYKPDKKPEGPEEIVDDLVKLGP